MRVIPTRIPGILGDLTGILLIAVSWLIGFADRTSARSVPVALGAAAILHSLAANHERGVFPLLSMPLHLALDAGSGIILAASPWLLGFSGRA